jgi:cobalt-zinc-cadmium efflux system outer membrane protein
MLSRFALAFAIVAALSLPNTEVAAEPTDVLTLTQALRRALAANPRLTAADRDIGIAAARRQQADVLPNPELSFELDNVLGSGDYRGLRSAETTLQLSQLVELGGKRAARTGVGTAELDAAHWQRAAVRLEILSDTAVAFFGALSAQRRVRLYDIQIAALQRLTPLLQRRVEAGASSPAEVARAQVAVGLVRADRERARTSLAIARLELATLMGKAAPDFGHVVGDQGRAGQPPAFNVVRQAIDGNPQLVRWTAVRAQRDAELLVARLKPVPDLRAGIAWRHFRDTGDNAVRLGVSMALPVWDQNLGGIAEARESRAKADAEHAAAKAALLLTLGRAYETMSGAAREIELLRSSAIPAVRRSVEATESGYSQGRFTLLELLDAQNTATQATLREIEALLSFHTSLATIEGLTGMPLGLAREKSK